jgi:hypothetical protein
MFKIKLSNKVFYTLVAIIVIVLLAVGINALIPGVVPNPGHDIQTISPPNPCNSGEYIRFLGGSWDCEPITSIGDITGVIAGTGLLGGGLSGEVTLSTDTNYLQRRVTGWCDPPFGAIWRINTNGSVECSYFQDGGGGIGDITAVYAGVGLTGGGTTGAVTLNNGLVNRRCAAGQFVTGVSQDGIFECSTPSGGVWPAYGWVYVATDVYDKNVNPSNTCQINGLWSCPDSSGEICRTSGLTSDHLVWASAGYWRCGSIAGELEYVHCCGP